MEIVVADANSNLSDDTEEVDVNSLYFEVVGGEKKRRVYGLGSQSLYPDSNSTTSRTFHPIPDAAEERIKVLVVEVLRMRETQERILQQRLEEEMQQHIEQEVQQRVEQEVQQRVEQEVALLRQQSDDRFRSIEEHEERDGIIISPICWS
nr:cancer-related regulator of actin dynamics homolog [Nicotiana tomentosiformis]XP_009606518.1 cancer-related regulator of actin dynamics homolog [Nicotiana tomentosiformis]XP_009606519.1 cancer-related regulator of actin dynamics homolog [Nicotiana tomentosiformis]